MALKTMNEKVILNRSGYRSTGQRLSVLNVLKSEKGHLNALDVHTALRRKRRRVSLATVYRTLDLLVRLNLAKKVNVAKGPSVFEFDGQQDANGEHVHLVCRECGQVIDARPPGLSQLLKMKEFLAKKYDFEITHVQITFSGSCVGCKEQ